MLQREYVQCGCRIHHISSTWPAGTQDDPIPAERGMEYVYGLHYLDSEDCMLYLCQRTGEAAGGTVVLQYLPHELIGHYFVDVS